MLARNQRNEADIAAESQGPMASKPGRAAEPGSNPINHYPRAAELFSAIMRGEPPAPETDPDAETREALRIAAVYHGAGPLVAEALSKHSPDNSVASKLLEILGSGGPAETALDLLKERELVRVLEEFGRQGIHPLLIKGTPLAYSHYPSPAMRPRGDTDMLVPEEELEPARMLLSDLGYRFDNATSGQFISHQFTAEKRDELGVEHLIDVHWRLSNHQLFAEMFSYEELSSHSVATPALGLNARTLSPVHALIFACAHRVGHIHAPYYVNDMPHYGGDRLIWLYDIHLLVTRMSSKELKTFAATAAEKKVRTVCLDGLNRARDYFDTALPGDLVESLKNIAEPEPSARYLVAGGVRHFFNEIRALPGWRTKATLLKEHAFPPADYVLEKYSVFHRAWLPALYLHRGLRGIWKLVRRP